MRDRWWICGPSSYTLDILPGKSARGQGYVYGLLFDSGFVKIGKTANPSDRIRGMNETIRLYGSREIVAVGLSHPTANHSLLETKLHRHFADKRIKNELFRCTLAEVEAAIPLMGISETWTGQVSRKRSRMPYPWFWNTRQTWYVQIGGKQIKLSGDREMAWNAYVERMTENGYQTELTKDEWLASTHRVSPHETT